MIYAIKNTNIMKKVMLIGALLLLNFSCSVMKKERYSIDDGQLKFGYYPLDPLPVKLNYKEANVDNRTKNKRLMQSLPDETMRLAIGEVTGKSNMNFSSAQVGYEGKSYVVILDYIKFDTKPYKGSTIETKDGIIIDTLGNSDEILGAVIPVYVGVGLRLTASVTVFEGKVDLGNLFALGIAAEAKKVSGTLVIQTLGISGESISTLIPIPSEINITTIQNAILSIGAIKAKIYEDDIMINPRVVGFYNNIGGNQQTVNSIISNFLNKRIEHTVE